MESASLILRCEPARASLEGWPQAHPPAKCKRRPLLKHALALLIAALAAPALADDPAEIAIALTDEQVEVDTGFAGARLTLFGAVTGVDNPAETVDIVSVVRGPDARFRIRRLERRNLIWTPGAPHLVEAAPGLYITTATRPVTDIAPLPDQAAYRLGADHLDIAVTAGAATQTANGGDAAEAENGPLLYRNAFLTEIEDKGLYRDIVGGVEFKKGGLFTIDVDLPATTPVGEYAVAVYLYRDGVLLGQDATRLSVDKVGIERQIYDLAHDQPVTYGVLCVAMSLFAGWIASVAFRK